MDGESPNAAPGESAALGREGTERKRPSTETPAELRRQALAAFYRENEDETLQLLLRLLKSEPDDPRARYLAALCSHLLTREELLEELCAYALRHHRHHPFGVACEAVRYMFLANFSRAEDLFDRALGALPDDIDLLLGLGILYEYSDNREKGSRVLERVLELDPNNVRARIALGAFYAMDGEFGNAMDQYEKAKAVEPDTENPHQRLGRDYYFEGMVQEAASEFGLAIAEEPDSPAAWFYLLDCLRRQSNADDALDVYGEIRQRFGDDPETASGFYEHFNMHAEAVASLEDLAAKSPDRADVLLRLSRVYQESKRAAEAVDAAEKAARVAPDDFRVFALLGDLYLELEQYDKAIANCRRAISLNRDAQSAYTTMADALLYQGKQNESYGAVQEMERIREEAWKRYQAKFSGEDRADGNALR